MTEAIRAWEENPHSKSGINVTEELQLAGFKPEDHGAMTHDKELDEGIANVRFRRNKQRLEHELTIQSQNREDRLKDHDYYDGDQWGYTEAQELENRGQDALVINRIKPTIDWISGTEKRTRVDYRVLPREADDSKSAEVKTKLLKYVQDVNKAGHHRSQAFQVAVKSGLSWLEVGIRKDPEDEPLFVRHEDWRNIIHDSRSVSPDYQDARYLFRIRWVDVDIACAMFPDRVPQILASVNTYDIDENVTEDVDGMEEALRRERGDSLGETSMDGTERHRVRLVECWYKEPAKVKVMRKGDEAIGSLNNAIYDEDNPEMVEMVESGMASTFDALRLQVRQMIFCGNYLLMDQPSPYAHNRIPFIPVWAFRKFRDGSPYGVVRNLRDLQYDLNKRRSKALHILSTNKILATDKATNDWDELYKEAQMPDGIIRYKSGQEVQIVNETELVERHVMLMHDDERQIEAAAGVTDENMGRETNASSGKAIQARQDQGHVVTAELFDNFKLAIQLAGEMELSLIEQFYTDYKVVRLTGDKGQVEWEEINAEDPETGEILNDITATQADFKVDTQDWNATVRQMMFQAMGDLMSKMDSELTIQFMDLWLDLADIPGKDEMVKRVRAITGQEDPDADDSDPEAQERKAAKEEAEAFQAEMEQRLAIAEVEAQELGNAETEAEIRKKIAEVRKIMADIQTGKDKATTDRAKVLADIEKNERDITLQTAQLVSSNENAAMDRSARQPMGTSRESG